MVKEVPFRPRANSGRRKTTPTYDKNGNLTPDEIKRAYYRDYYRKRKNEDMGYMRRRKIFSVKGPKDLKPGMSKKNKMATRPFIKMKLQYEVPLMGLDYDPLEDTELMEQIALFAPTFV